MYHTERRLIETHRRQRQTTANTQTPGREAHRDRQRMRDTKQRRTERGKNGDWKIKE